MRFEARFVLCALLLAVAPQGVSSGREGGARPKRPAGLFQEASFQESALNDPEAAIRIYDEILALPQSSLPQRARAHLRKGICLRRLGRWLLAEEEFETVLGRYGAVEDAVRVARRFVGLTARLMPPDAILFLELVDPGSQVEFLKKLIQGTPLENPVDNYLRTSENAADGGRASGDRADGDRADVGSIPKPRDEQLASLRAVLNLDFLNELQKIEGLAVGATSVDADDPQFVAVLLPGSSVMSRWLVTLALTLFSEERAGKVHGMTVFKLSPGDIGAAPARSFFIATGNEREVVFFGRPRQLVEDAIRRHRSSTPLESLADQLDFRRAQEARAVSSVFAYLDRGEIVETLRRQETDEAKRAQFDLLSSLSGVDALEGLSLTLSRSGGDLRLALGGGVSAEVRETWEALLTPLLDPSLLRFVPPEPLGFLAFSVPDLPDRLRTLGAHLKENHPQLGTSLRQGLLDELAQTDGGLERVLAGLRSLAIVVPGKSPGHPTMSFYVVAEFEDGARIERELEALLERLLGELVRALYNVTPGTSFEDGPTELTRKRDDLSFRTLTLSPSWKAGYARSGNFVLVALNAVVLEPFFEEPGALERFPTGDLPVAASKLLYLRPREILEVFFSGDRSIRQNQFLSRIDRATIYTVETAAGLSLELKLPNATPILRDILNSLPVTEGRGSEERAQEEKQQPGEGK